jgi:hypothetical protein
LVLRPELLLILLRCASALSHEVGLVAAAIATLLVQTALHATPLLGTATLNVLRL